MLTRDWEPNLKTTLQYLQNKISNDLAFKALVLNFDGCTLSTSI